MSCTNGSSRARRVFNAGDEDGAFGLVPDVATRRPAPSSQALGGGALLPERFPGLADDFAGGTADPPGSTGLRNGSSGSAEGTLGRVSGGAPPDGGADAGISADGPIDSTPEGTTDDGPTTGATPVGQSAAGTATAAGGGATYTGRNDDRLE